MATNGCDSDGYVMLDGGLAVPVEPLRLLLALERRGCSIARDGNDGLLIGPRKLLTADDCQAIGRWKRHLLALVDYRPPSVRSVRVCPETAPDTEA